ncbi:PDR/VanB family oxidoreductase [Nocardia sp. BMG111209]|uniref:PDR/VanB family oxidoreductase n=1 Tax=Nocardia sp. BMG111209 TaxID=1160137 RepID=UPI000380FB05|nr:PDR/VanB family oxidoreductase [Nocardia sp. BMG111209]
MTAAATLELTVTAKEFIAEGVAAITLAHPGGRRLPDWTPGAHLDLILPGGRTRQYSLCGDRRDPHRYDIAVRREPDGRGGSAHIHDVLAVGDTVPVGSPRNNFALAPADRYLFVAGGIGITALLPMIAQADLLGADWRLHYAGRSLRSMAFAHRLGAHGSRVRLHPADEDGRGDVRAWLDAVAPDTMVYCCGPATMIDAVRSRDTGERAGRLRTERFTPAAVADSMRDNSFQIRLRRSGRLVTVPPDRSVLEALQLAGTPVLSSCRQGVCGTCETTVLDGVPDHRDAVLDDLERAAGDRMLVCVSRARSGHLVLDL